MLAISLAISIILWFILPGLLVVIFSYGALSFYFLNPISENEFIYAYALETAATVSILFLFLKFSGNTPRRPVFNPSVLPKRKISIMLMFFLYFVFLVYQLKQGNFNYMENNSASRYDQQTGDSPITVFGVFLFSAIAILAVYLPRRSLMFFISVALLCAGAFIDVMGASRIAFFTPIAILCFRYLKMSQFKIRNFVFFIIVVSFLIYAILFFSLAIEQTRTFDPITFADIQDANKNSNNYDIVIMMFQKFNSFSSGVSLVKDGGGMGSAGLMPYYGSAMVFIPRAVWPDRPVAGSSDGTIYGHPSRVVPEAQGDFSDASNVGVSSLYTTFWEFDVFGFPIFVLSGIVFLLFLNRLLLSNNFSTVVVGVFLLSIPTFHLLMPAPDVMLQQAVIATGVLIVFAIVRRLNISKLAI